jgi:recombination protein RecT
MYGCNIELPINNNLGFAYIVPFKNNKENKIEQFQLGYKGYIQLAQRSGQFSRIAATPVYRQLISENPLLGYEFDWSVKPNGNPIGYVAFSSS